MAVGIVDMNFPAQVEGILPRYIDLLGEQNIAPVFVWAGLRTADIQARLAAEQAPLDSQTTYVISPDSFYCDALSDEVEEFEQSGEQARLVHVQFGVEHVIARGAFLETCPDFAVRKLPQAIRAWARDREGITVKLVDLPGRQAYLKPDLSDGGELLRRVYEKNLPRTEWETVNHHLNVLGRAKMRNYLARLNMLYPIEDRDLLEMGASCTDPVVADLALGEFGAKSYTGVNVAPFGYEIDHPRSQLVQQDIHEFKPPGVFDIAFSFAALEHIPRPVELIHIVPKWLRSCGVHYGIYFVWSSSMGHHVHTGVNGYQHIEPFDHMRFSETELSEELERRGVSDETAAVLLHRMYRDPYVNRVGAKDILDALLSCGLEPIFLDLRNGGRRRRDVPDVGMTAEELSIEGFEFMLRKSEFDWRDIAGR